MSDQVFLKAAAAAREVQDFLGQNKLTGLTAQGQIDLKLCAALAADSAASTAQTLPSRPTIGVFGPSQAGKSHLVSRLAADNGVLEANIGGERLSFIKHINPPGGDREATGFITRFTHAPSDEIEGFPIRVKIFNECDIVKILVNAFAFDCDLSDLDLKVRPEDLLEHILKCKSRYASYVAVDKSAPTIEDLVSLSCYIQNKCGTLFMDLKPDSRFWLEAYDLLPKLPLKERIEVLSCLWDGAKVFSFYYYHIVRELLKFEGQDHVYVPVDAFCPKNDQGVRDSTGGKQHNLINIRSLENILNGGDDLIEVALDAQKRVTVPFACLAAVSLEITFPLAQGCAVDNFDVLDFPGARTREKKNLKGFIDDEVNAPDYEHPSQFMIKDGWEFVRRGKVAYLFDRSSQRGEVDVLLMCISMSAQLEVTEIVTLAKNWVQENVGRTPQDRAALKHNPFYVVLTRSDEPLTKEINQKKRGVGSNVSLFIKTPLERMLDQEWMKNWAGGNSFNNCFLVRKPGMSGEWIELEGENELAVKSEYQDIISELISEIKRDPLYKQYVRHEESIDEMVKLNDGGIGLIAQDLQRNHQDPKAHDKSLRDKCRPVLTKLYDLLNPFAFFGAEAQKQKAYEGAVKLSLSLMQCSRLSPLMGAVREALELDDEQLSSSFENIQSAGSVLLPYAQTVCRFYKEKLESLPHSAAVQAAREQLMQRYDQVLSSQSFGVEQEKERYSFFYKENGALKSRAEASKDFGALMEDWSRELLKLLSDPGLDLTKELHEALKEYEHASSHAEYQKIVCAHLCKLFFSDFSSYLGAGMQDGQKAKRIFGVDPEGFAILQESDDEVFSLQLEEDEGYLPDLKADEPGRKHYDLSYLCDYFSALTSHLVRLSLQGTDRAGAVLGQEDNARMCRMVTDLKKAAEQ